MKRQKKQYRPIAGQTRLERFLDWVTRDEFFSLVLKYHFCFLAYSTILILIAHTFDRSETAYILLLPFFGAYIFWIPASIINIIGSAWGLRVEHKLKKPITDYIETHGRCTYDELVARFMPLKIHLGIDAALETMLGHRELVLDGEDRYRLPTDEDRKRWREERLAEYGAVISFEELEKIFALDLNELEEGIDIEFSLGEHDGYWMGKTEDESSGAEVFWCGEQIFASFRDMAAAKLFDGQSLESAWDKAIITFINDEDIALWLEEYLL